MNYHKNIISKYNIKKYIHSDFVDKLNNVRMDFKCYESILNTQNNIVRLICTDETMSKVEKVMSDKFMSISEMMDVDDVISLISDKNKQRIMSILVISKFIPLTIIHWIETKCSHYYHISWDNVNIYVLNDKPVSQSIIDNIVRITKWIMSMTTDKSNKSINLYIYLSEFKKEIGYNGALGTIETNSGVSLTDEWLQIFRKEELYKVLIHELLHNLELDYNKPERFTNDVKIIQMHDDSRPILINEAYTEVIALYLHSLYIGTMNNLDIWQLIIDEEKFTIYQINKIFKHYNIVNIKHFSKPNKFIQHTNIIPYFIIKYLFLLNIKYFVLAFNNNYMTEWLMSRSMNKIFKLQIVKCKVYDKSLKMVYHDIK
jgi:hypothetical protein